MAKKHVPSGPGPHFHTFFMVCDQNFRDFGPKGGFFGHFRSKSAKIPEFWYTTIFFYPRPKIDHKSGYRSSFSDLKVSTDSWDHAKKRFVTTFRPDRPLGGSPDPKAGPHDFQTGPPKVGGILVAFGKPCLGAKFSKNLAKNLEKWVQMGAGTTHNVFFFGQ